VLVERPVIRAVSATWPSHCFSCIKFRCPYLAPASHIRIPYNLIVLTNLLPFAFFEKRAIKEMHVLVVTSVSLSSSSRVETRERPKHFKIRFTCISQLLRLQICYLEIPKITTWPQPSKWVQH